MSVFAYMARVGADVEHGDAQDGIGVIEAQPMGDPRAAIVAREPEAREGRARA